MSRVGLPRLYVITDRKICGPDRLTTVVRDAARAGARLFQLREKDLSATELLELAEALHTAVAPWNAMLLLNDRADLALAAGAAGVHLTASSMPAPAARQVLGPEAWIGRSTHSVADVREAVESRVDFVVFGPVFETPSKAPYGPPLGVAQLHRAVEAAGDTPVFAIGGITPGDCRELRNAGAHGVAVIRAVMDADDPARAVHRFLESLEAGPG